MARKRVLQDILTPVKRYKTPSSETLGNYTQGTAVKLMWTRHFSYRQYEFDILTLRLCKRGAVVEWLEQLGYGAESRRIAWVRGSAAPCGDWKTLSVNPAENGYLFRIREG